MLCADLPASVVRITRKHVIYELADFYSAAPAPNRRDGESLCACMACTFRLPAWVRDNVKETHRTAATHVPYAELLFLPVFSPHQAQWYLGVLTQPRKENIMIVGIAHLFNQTKENIAAIRGVKVSGFVDSNEIACVNNRAVQVCTLDFLLELHRKKYGNNCNGLNGIRALHHKLLMKYQWPPSVIRGLSLSDIFLSLHDELQLESLPEDAGRYLLQITRTQYPINFPDYLDGEWDPDLSQRFLAEIPD